MSDISIRLDGILLLAGLLLGAAIYLLVALISAGVAFFDKTAKPRARRVAGESGLMAIGALLGLLILYGYLSEPYGVFFDSDWLDWVLVPWAIIFAIGCWRLTRIRGRGPARSATNGRQHPPG